MEPNVLEPQPNVSYEGRIEDPTSEIGSVALGSDHHVEELVTNFVESMAYYMNPLFTDLLGPPLTDPPSTRYVDDFSS
jgi:hypothetical protein